MKRQTIAMLTLGSFVVFSFSCYSVREIKPATLASPKAKNLEILRLEKTSGESIVFSKNRPGAITGDSVQGIGALESSLVTVEIEKTQVKTINSQEDRVVSVTTKDNQTYPVQKIIQKPETLELRIRKITRPLLFESVSVALSEVQKAYAKTLDIGKTLTAILVPAGVVIFAVALIIGSSWNFATGLGGWKN